jgi:hypothetical protein
VEQRHAASRFRVIERKQPRTEWVVEAISRRGTRAGDRRENAKQLNRRLVAVPQELGDLSTGLKRGVSRGIAGGHPSRNFADRRRHQSLADVRDGDDITRRLAGESRTMCNGAAA